MVRQFWIHLLEDDEPGLLRAIEDAAPGSFVVPGRFARGGDVEAALRNELSGIEFAQLSKRQVERLVFHRQASKTLVTHPVEEGPLAGARSIDASFSDCFLLTRPEAVGGFLEPSRLTAETHVMKAEKKHRKSPSFSVWVGVVLRALRARYGHGAVDFIHLGASATTWCEAGQGKLSYLYQPISPQPANREPTVVTTPQKR